MRRIHRRNGAHGAIAICGGAPASPPATWRNAKRYSFPTCAGKMALRVTLWPARTPALHAGQRIGILITRGAMPEIDYAAGLLWYFVFLYSTVCHEAAHAWAALKLGDDTAYQGGQVSLDPVPHIRREPWGMVIVPLITFYWNAMAGVTWMMGWASAPYDPECA